MNKKAWIIAGAVACIAAVPALAGVSAKKNRMCEAEAHSHMMDKGKMMMDKDGDGFVTKEEFDAQFRKVDKDGDGKVSRAEWKEHMRAMMKKRMKRRAAAPQEPDSFEGLNR